jgi:hypothetical protein
MSTEAPEPPKRNGNLSTSLLQLASGADNWVKLATIGLIILSGGGNWLATWRTGDENRQEVNQAINEVHQLYNQLNNSMDRQRDILDTVKRLEQKLNK